MVSSVARCCASAALPPLPNSISLPPPRMDLTQASTSPANAAPSAASLLRATSACSANSDLKNAARSMRLGRLASKFGHCIAQRLVDDRAFVARQPLLQSRDPSADRLQRRLHGLGRNDA